VQVFGIIGRQGSGKTHLIERLVVELRRRNHTVSTIKHTHHHVPTLDSPGKDSFRHRAAGAQEVIVASDDNWTLLRHSATPAPLDLLLEQLSPVDVVLVEGYKTAATLPRIEVFRALDATPPLATADPSIALLARPAALGQIPGVQCPQLDLDDTHEILDAVLCLTTGTRKPRSVHLAS
jgi:molybdopterin-guanine dinucleotide biosynthesis protein MobB